MTQPLSVEKSSDSIFPAPRVVFVHADTVKSSVPLGSEYESATTICPVIPCTNVPP